MFLEMELEYVHIKGADFGFFFFLKLSVGRVSSTEAGRIGDE